MPGLESSRYANASGFEYTRRPGDWNCPSCKFSNFASRTSCLRCCAGNPPPFPSQKGNPPTIGQEYQYPWAGNGNGTETGAAWYQRARTVSYPTRAEPTQCATPPESADEVGMTSYVGDELGEEINIYGGLSTSRWAPRNHKFRGQNGGQVWTKTTQLPSPIQTTSNNYTPPTHPDLGLPYEVQHYILTMTQRLLEEGCYAFATRWTPEILQIHNLTCSEAVELSEWRKLLSQHAPPRALHPLPHTTLEKALANAVRIRNKAVHRHLCDNGELRRMAAQAGELMGILGDEGRRGKFVDLAEGICEWDRDTIRGVGDEERKLRLENVLRGVGERDVGGMDWTPNEVSLEEVNEVVVRGGSDHMDID
ncbi:hypothetical protein HYFRA_00010728 [Hymenoscyphus fraxineus]|uniref:RanBP2-type domain-containing protein n=1 Tax=Hymenoscyphus fraxineus TaxID=746836 RepID=A0A9N9PVI8_9HELO|nr:hypothetical protein HYFRA_00010728 [Hymenoscyphus fraxineus]